jgi:hypothetical protein
LLSTNDSLVQILSYAIKLPIPLYLNGPKEIHHYFHYVAGKMVEEAEEECRQTLHHIREMILYGDDDGGAASDD